MRFSPALRLILFLLVVGALCSARQGTPGPQPLSAGLWGGRGVTLEVSAAGAKLEFDCAHGSINEPIRMSPEGIFDLSGSYQPETGGPERAVTAASEDGQTSRHDQTSTRMSARFLGQVNADRMTLKIVGEGGKDLGSYHLRKGSRARLFKCR